MQTNVLTSRYVHCTLGDVLFEKQQVLEPIVNNVSLSPKRRLSAMNDMIEIEEILKIFEAAIEADMQGTDTKSCADLIREVYGKSVEELAKEQGLVAAAGTMIGSAASSVGKTTKGLLNKAAAWVADKTK